MKLQFVLATLVCLAAAMWAPAILAQCSLTVPTGTIPPAPPGYVCPDGGGTPAAEAWFQATYPNVTITAILRDGNGDPIANYPWEDMWIEYVGFCQCDVSTQPIVYADYNTDANGETVITSVVAGGTCLNPPAINLVTNGSFCPGAQFTPSSSVKSLDLNCDGIVNLDDKDVFSSLYPGDFCLNFNEDTKVDLKDWALMTPHVWFEHKCP